MRLKQLLQNSSLHTTVVLLCVIGLFATSTFLSQRFEAELIAFATSGGVIGMFTYVIVTAGAIVVAPVSSLPLMPLAVGMWGWFVTGVLSIIGWTLGSQIAFALARKYGKTLVQRLMSLERLNKFEKKLSTNNIFWTVILLRMIMPVDVLSYALGLFSNISGTLFFLSTVIGVTPFAFIFSYLGSLPPGFQLITLIEIVIFILIAHYFLKKEVS